MRAALLSAVLVASLGLTACTADADPEVTTATGTKTKSAPAPRPTASEEPESDPTTEAPTEPEGDAAELSVVNAGYGPYSYDETTWWYVVIVNNPNDDRLFSFAEVTVEAVGADGTILDSSTNYLNVLPGDTAVSGAFFEVGTAQIDHLEVRGPGADESEAAPPEGLGAFTVSELTPVTDEYSTTVTGVLSGTFADEQENVSIVVVALDPAGAIIGGEFSYVERLPVDGRAQFEVWFGEPLPADTTFVGYATP